MYATLTDYLKLHGLRTILIDLFAVGVIFLMPTFSHLIGFPLYLLEPMRIMIVVSLLYTRKENAVLIALLLPMVSFLLATHPSFAKAGIMSVELMLNVLIFIALTKKYIPIYISLFISIVLSKLFYYLIKYLFIQIGVIDGVLITTPLYMQVIVTLLLTVVSFILFRGKNVSKN